MKTITRVCAVIGIVAVMGGCETINDTIQQVAVDPVVEIDEKDPDTNKYKPLDLMEYTVFGKKVYGGKEPTPIVRNMLQEAIIAKSEIACSDFRKRLFAYHAVRKTGMKSVYTMLSAAATAVGGNPILSAAATSVSGIDGAIDSNFLQKQMITAILNTIKIDREKFLERIHKKQRRGNKRYNVNAAVADGIHYNRLCSLTEALSSMHSAIEKKFANADALKQAKIIIKEKELAMAMEKLEQILAEEKLQNIAPDDAIMSGEQREVVKRLKEELKALKASTTNEVLTGNLEQASLFDTPSTAFAAAPSPGAIAKAPAPDSAPKTRVTSKSLTYKFPGESSGETLKMIGWAFSKKHVTKRIQVQKNLCMAASGKGKADGRWGLYTHRALIRYQQITKKVNQGGVMTEALWNELLRMSNAGRKVLCGGLKRA